MTDINTYIPWLESLKQWEMGLVISSAVLLLTAGLSLIAKKSLKFFISKTTQYENRTVLKVTEAIHLPLQICTWSYGIIIALHFFILDVLSYKSVLYEGEISGVILCATLGWTMSRVLNTLEPHFITKAVKSGHTPRQSTANVRALTKIVKIILWSVLILIILGLFQVPLSGLLTFGGVGGIGVALASKDLLANFAGGVMVFFNRHFTVGDWIYSPDRDLQGTVEDIGWRLTKIRSFDQRPVYVPNSIFNNVIIVNASKMNNRRIYQTIGLRYEDADKVEAILEDVRIMLAKHADIDQSKTILVNLDDKGAFGAYNINFIIYAFTKSNDWATFKKVQDNVLLNTFHIIKSHGADIAFPTQTLIHTQTPQRTSHTEALSHV